jgi:hypothetical protein
MVHMLGGLQTFVHLEKVDEAVANADDTLYAGLLGLLAREQLLYRIIVNKPDVGMSVEVSHLSSVGLSDEGARNRVT